MMIGGNLSLFSKALLQQIQQVYPLIIQAGEIAKLGLIQMESDSDFVKYKGDIDLVTRVDMEIETYLTEELTKIFPGFGIIGEEKSNIEGSYGRFFIDPLDGTTNYVHKIPHFAVSVALEVDHELVSGWVYNPISEEFYTAIKQSGAFLGKKPIRVSKVDSLKKSVLATGFPYHRAQIPDNNHKEFEIFNLATQGVRRLGAASLDLSYVACGRLDGFWEKYLHAWDMAAGILIIKEAGGVISDYCGNPPDLFGKELLVSNGLIHQQMKEILSHASK